MLGANTFLRMKTILCIPLIGIIYDAFEYISFLVCKNVHPTLRSLPIQHIDFTVSFTLPTPLLTSVQIDTSVTNLKCNFYALHFFLLK